ncbi:MULTISPECIES: DUF6043 family protein [unclassified Prevotella]|uniref:DUF6043 family protein n=1 Tax=unclassified Prevotella TaxID=2638335 RepID=UPI0008B592BD|nr:MULTISPECIES: DUF6043 family protein [unclassified Prevotella]SES67862.1 hypothetical protein SAMN04487825_1024 [Prevotella sp. kh1p2]SFF81362.1 hypothetical protein SAMN05216383_10138 [Prevotella sp. KH2C16]SNU10242.1 hypothetical protein SAMN06298210_1023 [Prevotellaceae bacterium KH2P17]
MGAEHKGDLLIWYQANKVPADRIINDLKKQSLEAVMHLYAYTAKSLELEHIVSQRNFPFLFSNNYTRVGDTIVTAIVFLLSEGNMNFLRPNRIRNTLKYWLFYGNLYETTVSKIIVKTDEARERLEKNSYSDLQQQLVETSVQNGIKTQHDWDKFFGIEISEDDEDGAVTERKVKQIPAELQTEAARQILDKAISLGLCDNEYHWQKTNSLLAYFADCACEHLKLSKAEQDGKKKTYWKPFETLFGVSGLANYKNTYTNKTGKLPIDHEIVESIFR